MARFKAVIFDLDGTLLDTLKDLALSMNRVLERNGLPVHPEDRYRYFVGDGARTLVYRAVPESLRENEDALEELLAQFLSDYKENWDRNTRLYEGIEEMLDQVMEKGLKMAVLSNKPHEFTRLCVERYLGQWNFHKVLGELPEIPRKPDPTGALTVARDIGIDPKGFLYLGDTSIDMKTANQAGMYPVGVLWGFRDRDELKNAGAQTLLKRPQEIASLL